MNASGIESPELAAAAGLTPFVEMSASGRYLRLLRERAAPGASVVLGAGLVPGLSTVLVHALETRPGDEVDLFVMLGSGERHGRAATAWTLGLAGTDLHDPPGNATVRNLVEHRYAPRSLPRLARHRYLRADFPDHVLTDPDRVLAVRTFLTLSSRLETVALQALGRVPGLAPLARGVPAVGSSDWHLAAVVRRTGEAWVARGTGQSRATGTLVASTAERVVAAPPGRPVAAHHLDPAPTAWWPARRHRIGGTS